MSSTALASTVLLADSLGSWFAFVAGAIRLVFKQEIESSLAAQPDTPSNSAMTLLRLSSVPSMTMSAAEQQQLLQDKQLAPYTGRTVQALEIEVSNDESEGLLAQQHVR